MNRSTLAAADSGPIDVACIDLTLTAQRILKLAEIALLEHLEALDRSQAVGLSDMFVTEIENTESR
jgi:hypothetical protein